MDINLTQEQIKEFLEKGYINVYMGDYRFYMELSDSSTNNIWYFELVKSKNGKTIQAYTHDISELELLKPKRPTNPSWYHNDPLCPNCQTYMIYKFEHCPRCGQKLDWSEK